MNPEKLPVPLPPEPESPKGLKALLQHRFLLWILVVILFFGLLFGLRLSWKTQTAATPSDKETPVAALPSEPSRAPAKEPPKPLAPEPLKVLTPEHPQPQAPAPKSPDAHV